MPPLLTLTLLLLSLVLAIFLLTTIYSTPTHTPSNLLYYPMPSPSASSTRTRRRTDHPTLQRIAPHPTPHLTLYEIPHFLTDEECDRLRSIPVNQFARGRTVDAGTDDAQAVHFGRTSTTVTLPADQQAAFHQMVSKRLPNIWQANDHEPTQLARYTEGQHYDYHHDFFEEAALKSTNPASPQRQRTWTLLVYLDDGGPDDTLPTNPISQTRRRSTSPRSRTRTQTQTRHTRRPHEYGGATHFGHPDTNITVYPERGKAILWNNLLPSGKPNTKTLHSGKPLGKGCEKRIVTQWFLEKGGTK